MKTRLATLDDKLDIARLHTNSWLTAFSKFAPALAESRKDQLPERIKLWAELLCDSSIFTLVAENNEDEIIGFTQGSKVREQLDLTYDGELLRLYVAPDSSGQGVGKRLINQVARRLQNDGYTSLVVVAWSINQPARKIYEYLGATVVKEISQTRGRFDTSQTVYVWKDIQTVIGATQ